jgi:hypothetical protein
MSDQKGCNCRQGAQGGIKVPRKSLQERTRLRQTEQKVACGFCLLSICSQKINEANSYRILSRQLSVNDRLNQRSMSLKVLIISV